MRSLTARVLAVNMVAVLMLAMGLLYLDRYKQNLIDTQIDSLMTLLGSAKRSVQRSVRNAVPS